MKRLTRLFVLALAGVGLGTVAHGAGFNTPQSGASYTAQGQGGITFFDNAGLVAQNPAAMVKLAQGTHVYGGLARYETDYTYEDLEGGNKASTTHDPPVAPHLYGLYNTGDWAVGTGLYLPFNSSIAWPDDWFGRDVLTRLELRTLNQPIVGAIRFGDLSVGGGVNFISAQVELEREVSTGGGIPAKLGGSGSTSGYNFSVLYDQGNWAAALQYNSDFTVPGDGKVQFDTSGVASAYTSQFPDGNISVELDYPALLEVGASLKSFDQGDGYQADAWAVEVGMLHASWSNYEEVRIKYNKQLPSSESVISSDWEDVIDYKIGGFYSVTDAWKIRTGYYRTASPIPARTLGPTTPDGAGRNSLYLGFGHKRDGLLLDVAALSSDFLPSTTRSNPELKGKYDGEATVLQLSVGASF
jgi:long-chain fatty acid transport protein